MRIVRTQPPVGYRTPFGDLARAAWGAAVPRGSSTDAFLPELTKTFRVRNAFAVSSGKAALTTVLRALNALTGRRRVILPAYTCYSVPSAIVKAGLDPVPCDIAKRSFDYNYEQLGPMLGPDVLCVLSVHLFGIPSDTGRLSELCRSTGIFVVEDAAQAMGVEFDDRLLGTRGDVGFFSLGRGKNVTSGSGGIIVTDSEEIAGALRPIVARLPAIGAADDVTTFLTLALLSVFVSPSLYWFPAGLPFLKLGETVFHEDFPIRAFSRFRALLLRDWSARLERLNAVRRHAADFYLRNIEGCRGYAPALPYLRFPLLVEESDARRRILAEGNGGLLGISGMYPTSVGAIPQLEGRLAERWFPEAERVAASLLTLPTHPLLSGKDLARICEIVNRALQEGAPVSRGRPGFAGEPLLESRPP